MAQRLATEYVKTSLQFSEAEMPKFVGLFKEQQADLVVRILDNGNQEVAVTYGTEEVVFTLERIADRLAFTGSCRLTNLKLANAMRQAVSLFKGDAVVHRIYRHGIMRYVYEKGSVVQISELKHDEENIVYQYKNTVGQLENLFKKDDIEREIVSVEQQVDSLLDLRNSLNEPNVVKHIDERLARLSHTLFVLEA